jgi:hypothetical protein
MRWNVAAASGRAGAALLSLLLVAVPAAAQDLDPRAYVHVPVGGTFFVGGLAISHGGVVTDPTLPATDITATVETPSVGVGRSFGLFGKTAQAFGVLPFGWAQISGKLSGIAGETSRSGLTDMRLRMSVLVKGAPAGSVVDLAKAPRRTILGLSLNVSAPTGEYLTDKLINLGTNRWAFKPELAVSHPMGERWLLDAYAAVWLFTANDSAYPGNSLRTQEPMGAFQGHLSYNFQKLLWAALDTTYYVGGRTTTNGIDDENRQSNLRMGATVNLPVGRRHSVKLAVSRGAIVQRGTDFTSFSIGWQTAWVPTPKSAR